MEPLVLKPRNPIESPDVERWDDDDFDNLEDVQFRTASTATSIVSHPQTNQRDSISSRLSLRSDSNQGDENWDVLVDDHAPIKDAIALARSKGIPLPANVPRSALEGGTIRRLRGKDIKKAVADDWSEDLDFAGAPTQLKLAKVEDRDLSESLRQISAAFRSSPKSPEIKDGFDTIRSAKSRPAPTPISLDRFKDDVDDDDGFRDVPTIRVAKHRSPAKATILSSPVSRMRPSMENIEEDLEFPADGKLMLSTRTIHPMTPHIGDDFDADWGEGSLGTRNAGTKRGPMSNRSSSALSPSVSSAFTVESEDEGLNGLVLPSGPLKFNEILRRKQDGRSPDFATHTAEERAARRVTQDSDYFDGLVLPDGEVFDSARLTVNRNIKQKAARPQSPGKRTTMTLNFTNSKTQGTISRLPRFQQTHDRHERTRSQLEPVAEAGFAVQRYQRPGSRLGHIPHSSISSIPTPSTPSRRGLRNVESRPEMRFEPTTTNAQLLRSKRSMPVIRNFQSPTKGPMYPRPSSRQDGASSRLNGSRPKTPTERAESRQGMDRRFNAPFLPAGSSAGQSQHVSIKNTTTTTSRHARRHDSDASGESMTAAQRSLSRLAGIRPDTPGKSKTTYTAAELAAQAKKTVTKPFRRRNFGDGSELEVFDDLPTSAATESKFVKQPIGRGGPRLRTKLGQSQATTSVTSLVSARSGAETPVPITPQTPMRPEFPTPQSGGGQIPRFARDTAASRIAREQRQTSAAFQTIRGEPLQPISANWKVSNSLRPTGSIRLKKRTAQKKPHLIKPLGTDSNRLKEEKGMSYNPDLFRWEGNENALAPFDVPEFNPHGHSPVLQSTQGNAITLNGSPSSKGNMALIMNVGGNSKGVQVVGGMVFDPRQMKWLKVAEGGRDSLRDGSGSVQLEEEEDVFAGLEDLKEEDNESVVIGRVSDRYNSNPASIPLPPDDDADVMDIGNTSGHSSDEWGVAEEFDVGPDFVRRQRSEEERWKRKVAKWLRSDEEIAAEEVEGPGGWRWLIREIVSGDVRSR